MIRNCPRIHTAQSAPKKEPFVLFKPLLVVASCTILFELLPIDFQHWIAPALVSYEEVYFSQPTSEESGIASDDEGKALLNKWLNLDGRGSRYSDDMASSL